MAFKFNSNSLVQWTSSVDIDEPKTIFWLKPMSKSAYDEYSTEIMRIRDKYLKGKNEVVESELTRELVIEMNNAALYSVLEKISNVIDDDGNLITVTSKREINDFVENYLDYKVSEELLKYINDNSFVSLSPDDEKKQ